MSGITHTVTPDDGRPYTVWISDYELATHGTPEKALEARMQAHIQGIYRDARIYGTD
jgi:hypothetical protein